MQQYTENQPIISIHIPKCGGTSVSRVLRKWFGSNYLEHYYEEANRKMPNKHPLLPGTCIHGHFDNKRGYGVKDYYSDISQYYTVLRDPIEMMLSNYFYMKKNFGWEWHYTNIDNYLQNVETYFFRYLPWDITKENFEEIFEGNFIAIGIMEQLQVSVDILAGIFTQPSSLVEHLNVTDRDETVRHDLKEKFIENNQLAYSIYEWAKSKLDQDRNNI